MQFLHNLTEFVPSSVAIVFVEDQHLVLGLVLVLVLFIVARILKVPRSRIRIQTNSERWETRGGPNKNRRR